MVLAGSVDPSDPAISQAIEAAASAGYNTGLTDCDVGAEDALGLPEEAYTVSVYLGSEQDAQLARRAFEERDVPPS